MSTTQHIDVEQYLDYLHDTNLHPDNIGAIERFIDHCASEGLSEVRQQRHAHGLKRLIERFGPDGFRLPDATEDDLKTVIARLNRCDDYSEFTKLTMKASVKKFYKVENGGRKHPEKVGFFSLRKKKATNVTREDLFTKDELTQLLRGFKNTRDRAFTYVLYESAARPGELLSRNIADFTADEHGDYIFLEGLKNTPDRTNQLVRAGRVMREWLAQHPCGGELGDLDDPSAPLWVKSEQQACQSCGTIPHHHDDEQCDYEPNLADRMKYDAFRRRFKSACARADIPKSKQRPYNLRHTRLTEVATFMGYEQLNKFAGWVPGSSRAKVYVHLNNDDVNQAIRDEYGLDGNDETPKNVNCPFCGATNQHGQTECRTCGRPLSLKHQNEREQDQRLLERLAELEEKGVLDKLDQLKKLADHIPASRRGDT